MIKMQDSRLDTISVPQIGVRNPATIAVATSLPMRLVVRNVGPVIVALAHSSNEISSVGATAGVYQLPPGGSEVIVLAPKQGLWAAGLGAGGIVSMALSEVLPGFTNA